MAVKWFLKRDDASWSSFWDKTTIDDELKEANNDYPMMLNAILGNSHKESVVLEGGCGLGKFLFFLRGKNYNNLIGVDFTDKPLKLIKQRDPFIDVRKGDVNDLPIDDESIDLYLSMGVIEHFEEGPQQSLNEAIRVLKKNGIGIFQVPIDYNRDTTFEDFSVTNKKERNKLFGQYDHVRIYGLDFFDRLQKAGFSVERCEYTSKLPKEDIIKFCLPKKEIIPICRK